MHTHTQARGQAPIQTTSSALFPLGSSDAVASSSPSPPLAGGGGFAGGGDDAVRCADEAADAVEADEVLIDDVEEREGRARAGSSDEGGYWRPRFCMHSAMHPAVSRASAS